MKYKTILTELQNLFFPNCCLVCNSKLLQCEESVCLQCLFKLPRTNNFLEIQNEIEMRLWGRFRFERIASFCYYTKGGTLPPLIHQLKYKNAKSIGILLGRLYGKDLINSVFIENIDFIVPVPLHPQKQKKRGYNQSEMIAKGLSESTGIALSTHNLHRTISNPTQTKRSKTQRWENVKGIFDIKDSEQYANKHILLVDDIITTGSTLEACVDALMQTENIKISIATLGEAI